MIDLTALSAEIDECMSVEGETERDRRARYERGIKIHDSLRTAKIGHDDDAARGEPWSDEDSALLDALIERLLYKVFDLAVAGTT